MHVACPSTGACVATDASGNAFTYYNGVWSAPTAIDAPNIITGVDCARQTATCVAIDNVGNASVVPPVAGTTLLDLRLAWRRG